MNDIFHHTDASIVRDRVQEWLTFKGLKSTVILADHRDAITAVTTHYSIEATVSLLSVSRDIAVAQLADNSEDVWLFAQAVADFMYCELTKG